MPVLNTTPTTSPAPNKGGVGNLSRCCSPTPPPSAAAGRGNPQHLPRLGEHLNADDVQKLWQSVVIQAVRDALMDREKMTNEDLASRRSAIAWIEGNGDDFHSVCEMAGISPEVVKRWWKTASKDVAAKQAAKEKEKDE